MARKSQVAPSVLVSNVVNLADARIELIRAKALKNTRRRPEEDFEPEPESTVEYGMFSQTTAKFLTGPERARFDDLLEYVRRAYQPSGAHEEMMVDYLACHWWRLGSLYDERAHHRRSLSHRALGEAERDTDSRRKSDLLGIQIHLVEASVKRTHKDIEFSRKHFSRKRSLKPQA